MPLDFFLQRAFAQLENALVPFEFPFEDLQGWEGHFGWTLRGQPIQISTGKTGQREGQAANPSNLASAAQKFLHLAEEAGGLRLCVLGGQSLELRQQFALTLGELLGRLDEDLHVHIAGLFGAQHRHAFALNAKTTARLAPFRDLHPRVAAVDGWYFELSAESRDHHGDRCAAMEIGALTLEKGMGRYGEEDIKIARRPAARASLAFACKADARSVLDPRRNIHRQSALARDPPRPGADATGIIDHLTSALTAWTSSLQGEEPLGMADAALSAASRTRLGSGAGFRARAGAGFTSD